MFFIYVFALWAMVIDIYLNNIDWLNFVLLLIVMASDTLDFFHAG